MNNIGLAYLITTSSTTVLQLPFGTGHRVDLVTPQSLLVHLLHRFIDKSNLFDKYHARIVIVGPTWYINVQKPIIYEPIIIVLCTN